MGGYLYRGALLLIFVVLCRTVSAQVSTYNFYQSLDTYAPGASAGSPASLPAVGWDDDSRLYTIPFPFTYNGVNYTTSGTIGVSSNGWIAFATNNITMTGAGAGGSYINASHNGSYLSGTANNNGVAGFNGNLAEQTFSTFNCTATAGSSTLTNVPVAGFTNLQVGTRLSGTGIVNGTVVLGFNASAGTVTMSEIATLSGASVTITPRSSILGFLTGTAPYRKLVIQYTQVRRAGTSGDNFNFQIIVNEGGGVAAAQNIQVVYGNCTTSAGSFEVQAGLRGASAADFNSRTTTNNWGATNASASNTDRLFFSSSIFPVSGTVFNWTKGPLPGNDNCVNAFSITPGTTCINTAGTSVNSNQQFPSSTCSGFTTNFANDVWYKFTADGTSYYSVSVTGTNGFDPSLGLYTDCNSANLITCVDQAFANGTETINAGVLAAGTYYYRIYGWGGSTGTFNTCVVYGTGCVAPVASPTNLILTPATSTINGSFTASSPAASGYLVIRTNSAVPPSNPVNGVTYTVGTSALGGTVEAFGSATTFSSNALQPLTNYCYWVYAYNNSACIGGPIYRTAYLTGCASTTACGAITTKTWSGPAAGGDFNTAANWTPSGVPTACHDVVINISSVSPITLSASATINSLTLMTSGGGQQKIGSINVGNHSLTILNTTNIDAVQGSNQSSLGSTSGGIISCLGNVVIGSSAGTGNPTTSAGSGLTGTSATKFIFGGNLTFGTTAFISTTPPGTAEFDGAGTQTITWNNDVFYANFNDVVIGNNNNPVVNQVTGTITPDNIKGNLTINGSSVLNLGTSQWNRNSVGGIMTMNGTSTLRLAGTQSLFIGGNSPGGVNVTGNNFPGGFNIYNLSPGSTVEYNSANGINQTIAPVTNVPVAGYGNLVLTNSSGSGSSTKFLSQNIPGGIAGNLTVNSYAVFDMTNFTANRSAAGGTFSLNANSRLRLSGTSGGVGPNNNFPSNFNTISFSTISITDYYGGAQGIFGGVQYGHLNLLNAGTKTAPAGDLVIKGNFTNTGSTFAHNNGRVMMSGTVNQTFAGVTYFNLDLSGGGTKSTSGNASITDSLKLNSSTNLTISSGDSITLLSGLNRTASVGIIPPGSAITYGTNSKFVVERYIPNHPKAWQFLAPTAIGQTVKAAWQEGAVTPNANPKPGYGTQLTSDQVNAIALGFDLFSAGGPSVKTYEPLTSGWTGIASTSINIHNKKGYMVFVRGNRSVTAFGQPATSTILRTTGTLFDAANLPPTTNVSAGRFESVANPYASAISPDKIILTGGVARNFYVWDPKLTTGPASVWGLGAFQTLVSNFPMPGYTIVPGGGSYAGGNYNIESGQAFLVAAPATAGTVSFNENSKVSGSNLVTRPSAPFNQVRVNLMVNDDNASILLDGTVTQYYSAYADEFDIMDVLKPINSGEMISTFRFNKIMVMERRNSLKREDTVFLRLANLKYNASYSLSVKLDVSRLPGQKAYLEDLYLNQVSELGEDEEFNYSFTANSNPRSFENRFRIIFRSARNAHANSNIIPGAEQVFISPNPVFNNIVNLYLTDLEAGNYIVHIQNRGGQLLKIYPLSVTGAAERINIVLPASVVSGSYTLKVKGSSFSRAIDFIIP